MIRAEIDANNAKAKQLADEQGLKVAQNVGAGVVGLVIWPIWFGMDFKDAAGKEVAALQARQQYLTDLAAQRCVRQDTDRRLDPIPTSHRKRRRRKVSYVRASPAPPQLVARPAPAPRRCDAALARRRTVEHYLPRLSRFVGVNLPIGCENLVPSGT